MKLLLFLIVLFLLAMSQCARANPPPLVELRVCGAAHTQHAGPNLRRADVLAAFKKAHPCPANGKASGACPGWVLDHVIPLECGGCDAVYNLQWQPVKEAREKDRWEIKAYCGVTP